VLAPFSVNHGPFEAIRFTTEVSAGVLHFLWRERRFDFAD
jgi:hypothetical protein